MVMAWPMPINRSRLSTRPARETESMEKKADPITTRAMAARRWSGFQLRPMPRTALRVRTTRHWLRARMAGGAAGGADIAEAPLVNQDVTGVVAEDVFEGRARMQGILERGGGVAGAHGAAVHHGHPVAQGVRLLHIVGGEQDGHAELP